MDRLLLWVIEHSSFTRKIICSTVLPPFCAHPLSLPCSFDGYSSSEEAVSSDLRLARDVACSLEIAAIIGRPRLWNSMFMASASKSCTVVSSATAKDRSCLETWGVKYPPMCFVPSLAPERPASAVFGAGLDAALMGPPAFSLSAAANLLIFLPFL